MSNMSRPTRPGRCTWAIAAARWSATRSPACSRRRGSPSRANIMSTTPAARSTRSPARRTCATARRSARTSARFPRGCIRATIWSRSAQALAAEFGDRYVAAPEGEWLDLFKRKAVAAMIELIKHDLGAARHPPRQVRVGSRVAGGGRARARRGDAARQGAGLSGRARSAQGPRRASTIGSRSS